MVRKPQKTGKKTTYHHGNLRDALVDAGLKILELEGLSALSLRRVAREAGVSQAAPYAHFADKAALLTAIATRGFDGLANAMEAETRGRDLGAMMPLGIGYVGFAAEHPGLFGLMFGQEISSVLDDELAVTGARSYTMIRNTTAQALADKHPSEEHIDQATQGAWALVHGAATLFVDGKLGGGSKNPDDARALTEAILTRWIVS
jgi:AcrR family transcriptional regulator